MRELFHDAASALVADPPRRAPTVDELHRRVARRRRRTTLLLTLPAVVALIAGLAFLGGVRPLAEPEAPASPPPTDSQTDGAVTIPDDPQTKATVDGAASDDVPSVTAPSSRQLANTYRLAASDWVIASVPPAGTELVLARRDIAEPDGIRVVGYGPTGGDDSDLTLVIEIDAPPSRASGESVTIAGSEWSVNVVEPGDWSVSRRIADTDVEVQGSGEIDEDLLGSLVVVDEAELPLEPLGRQSDARVVARTDFESETYTLAIQESGRHRCAWFSPTGDGGGHYCGPIPDGVLVIDGTQSIPRQPDGVVAAVWGSATNEVTTVEVEFVDGTVVTARPGDLSDSFDKRFWIAATAVATSLTTNPSVAAVRAYDSNGSLLAAEVPTPRG